MSEDEFNLRLSEFEALGEFAKAGLESARLALRRAKRSFEESRIPIAGAAVHWDNGGNLTTVTVGNNGRIPAPQDTESIGYPTDHGETAAIRQVDDVSAWDWARVVFATTLSPCIMCFRTLSYLYTLGLNKIVIAEAKTYPGTIDRLEKLSGMTLVKLANPDGFKMMQAFARTYPWDWAADIGEIPPGESAFFASLSTNARLQEQLCSEVKKGLENVGADYGAGVVAPNEEIIVKTADERHKHGGNPTYSAPMIAMGKAGSSRNLRECVLVFAARGAYNPVGIAEFGHSSLGACELFRPAGVLSNVTLDAELTGALGTAHIKLVESH